MPRKQDLFEFQGYMLRRHPAGRSPYLHVFWYERGARQGRYRSLGTTDVAEAQVRLVDWVMRKGRLKPGTAQTVTIAQCYARYRHRRADTLASGEQADIAIDWVLGFLGEGTLVAELTPQRQAELRQHLATSGPKGYRSPSTVSRILSVVRSALYDAVKHQELDAAPFIFDVPAKSPPRERVLSVDELARLVATAEGTYLETFLWLLIGTCGRKRALLELTRFQCDLERRIIRLNPEGRQQTNKRRATLPVCDFLAGVIARAPGPYLVQHAGRPLDDVKSAWRRTLKAAELEGVVTSNTVRRTVATWLRMKGVPEQECAGFMGHRWSNSTTEVYAPWRPDYLGAASSAVNELMNEVARRVAAHRATLKTNRSALQFVSPQYPGRAGNLWDFGGGRDRD